MLIRKKNLFPLKWTKLQKFVLFSGFRTHDMVKKEIIGNGTTTKTNRNLQEFTCGWGASFINISVTYPIYKVMFRQVANNL